MSNILNYIGVGRENAVDRFRLMELTGLPDRKVRSLIEDARREGALIVNAQDGAGYYISEDLGELKRQLNTNHSRAMSILVQQKYLRRKIKELEAEQIETETDNRAAAQAQG